MKISGMLRKDEQSIDPDFECAAVQGNVKTKLSTWLASIVDEVRRKSTVPLDTKTSNEHSSSAHSETITKEETNNLQVESRNIASNNTNSKKGWIKDSSIIYKFNKSFDDPNYKAGDSGQLSSLGRVKINQFYEKVFLNKARYNLLKTKKMDKAENITNIMLNDNIGKDLTEKSYGNGNRNPELVAITSQNNLDISFDNQDFSTFSEKLRLGEIGRSSTSKKPNVLTKRSYMMSAPKNITLGGIGRSFSEQIEEEEDDEYMLNERSRSCSHVINNRILNRHNSINSNNNVSTSLPSFFENKSISANPIPMKIDSPRRSFLVRDSSIQSDSSHCSSVESLLESRKPDPEAILINLGFGPVESEDILSRIPKRFLKPSQVRGIDTEAFLRRQQLASHLHDHSVLGYRGLVGNPDIPPSMIVAKIMERFEMNERSRCIMDMNRPQSAPPTPGPNT